MLGPDVNLHTIRESIDIFGCNIQSVICMEEMNELSQQISKQLRGKGDDDHLAEEMADVYICLMMLYEMYGVDMHVIQDWVIKKQKREEGRIKLKKEELSNGTNNQS